MGHQGKPLHEAGRAIADLTLGVVKSTAARAAVDQELALTETDQQYQIPVSGTARTVAGFGVLAITFDYPFYYAPGQRDSDLERPHMVYGAECDAFVVLHAHVQDWDIESATGAIVGATVVVACLSAADIDFTGKLHLTFQGFSSPNDDVDVTEG